MYFLTINFFSLSITKHQQEAEQHHRNQHNEMTNLLSLYLYHDNMC